LDAEGAKARLFTAMKDPLTPDPNADAPLSDDENALLNDMLQSGLPRRDFLKMMAGSN
jgi:hypothetical protein